MSINLDNPKTYHTYDQSESYEILTKSPRHFEKGFADGQNIFLAHSPQECTDFNIITTGTDKYIAEFIYSLSPFFLNIGLHVSTNFRLPIHTNANSLLLVIASTPNQSEIKSTILEIESKQYSAVYLTHGSYQTESQHTLSFQSVFHTLGFIFGLLTRFNSQFSKTIAFDKVNALFENTGHKLAKDIDQKNNPAKSLAQKHSQKAVLIFSSGHLSGVGKFISGQIVRQSKTFSGFWEFPEAKYFSESLFTYPVKALSEYQILLLSSDLFPNNVKSDISDFKQLLAQKRINYTEIKPDTVDWFEQIAESVVFLSYFSYYLSITNKVKI